MAEAQSIENLVQEWLRLDKNPRTRQEIQSLADSNNVDELEKRLRKRIAFGTAGLRAEMSAGFSRMNDLVVIQASQGLASYILSSFPNDARSRGVVIGHDHRHNSEQFAKLTAAAFLNKGIKVYFYDELVHTPLVPFGIQQLGAVAGVMITASHNPGQDNGYKVYWDNACQIISPHDKGIAAAILENLEPESWDTELINTSDIVEKPLSKVREAYLRALKPLSSVPYFHEDADSIRFVYTPMHGVGLDIMKRAVAGAGLSDYMVVVDEQASPDPDFPTVRFPNPEEKGALDHAISIADKHGIKFVLASDPDADRFACAQKVGSAWRVLTGNELGILLASHTLNNYSGDRSKLAMLCSTVSSQMLRSMASVEGFHFEDTLTGFKWLGNRALALNSQGYNAEFAFEEAIGYCFTRLVPDKDGIAAGVVFLALLKWLSVQEGKLTPVEYLETLYKKYGYFESCNSYLRSPDPALTADVFQQIRALGEKDGERFPRELGGRKIKYWRDLTVGYDSTTLDNVPTLPVDPSSQMITIEVDEGDSQVRATVRGSGTEPKIKYYVECKADSKEKAAKGAKAVAEDIVNLWFKPQETGLIVA